MMHTIINLDILAKPAFYLDPGSGSMIIQMVIAAVLGLGVATRVFWKNIKGWFTNGWHKFFPIHIGSWHT